MNIDKNMNIKDLSKLMKIETLKDMGYEKINELLDDIHEDKERLLKALKNILKNNFSWGDDCFGYQEAKDAIEHAEKYRKDKIKNEL